MDKVEILENGNIKITIPVMFRCRAGRKRIVTEDSDATLIDPVITNIARAFRWQALIDKGKFSNVHELARAIGKDELHSLKGTGFAAFDKAVINIADSRIDGCGLNGAANEQRSTSRDMKCRRRNRRKD